jgi:hypothetical protein
MRISRHLESLGLFTILIGVTSILAGGPATAQNVKPGGSKDAPGLDPRTAFCAKEFDYFVAEVNKLQTNYAVLASIRNAKVNRGLSQGWMESRFRYSTNFQSRGHLAPVTTSPYLNVDFKLGWQSREELAKPSPLILFALDQYANQNEEKFPDNVQAVSSRSGIVVFANVYTDNQALRKEIRRVFKKVVNDIYQWEKNQKPSP